MLRFWNALVGAVYNALNNGMFNGLFGLLDTLFRYAFAGPVFNVDAVTTAALGYTYANGSSGVGATLTKGSAGAFPTTDGVVQFLGMLVLVTGESTAARNGYYTLTRLGTSSVPAQLTRNTAWDTAAEMIGGSGFYGNNKNATVGSSSAGKVWLYTGASSPTVGTTGLTFAPASLLNSAAGASGTPPWGPVRLMTAASVPAYTYATSTQTVTYTVAGAQTVDGQTTALGDRIWLNNGAAAADQGLYVVTTKGGAGAEVWTRAPDANTSGQFVPGKLLETGPDGTANGNVIMELTSAAPITLDTTSITIGAPTNVMNVSGAQTITGAKTFATATLLLRNAAATFSATFTFLGTQARAIAFPDLAGPVAITGQTTSSTTPGAGGTTQPAFTGADPTAAMGNTITGFTGSTTGKVTTITAGGATVAAHALAGATVTDGTVETTIADNSALTATTGTITTVTALSATITATGSIYTLPAPVGSVASHTHTGAAHTHTNG